MNPVFNFYDADIRKSAPIGEVTMSYLLERIQSPKAKMKDIFQRIKKADEQGDLKTKQYLKTHLYSFTPCVYVQGCRKYDNIQNWTGLLVLDFDKIETDYAIEFKQALFNEFDYIIASWLSASQRGVRAFVSIPVCTSVQEFKDRYNAIEEELGIYNGFDRAVKNCILPMFMSYDKDLLKRENFSTFTKIKKILEPPKIKQYIINDKSSIIEKIIYNQLQTITDSGHPILRASAFLLGGFVAAGYIDEYSAKQKLNEMIKSHYYLGKKPDVYIKTAETMIQKGQSQPAYLKH
jgi:hypothetical protein